MARLLVRVELRLAHLSARSPPPRWRQLQASSSSATTSAGRGALSASVDVEWFACFKRFLILHLNQTPAPPTVLPPPKEPRIPSSKAAGKRGTQTLMSQHRHHAGSMNANPSRPPPQRSAQATHCSIGPMLHVRGMPNTTSAEH